MQGTYLPAWCQRDLSRVPGSVFPDFLTSHVRCSLRLAACSVQRCSAIESGVDSDRRVLITPLIRAGQAPRRDSSHTSSAHRANPQGQLPHLGHSMVNASLIMPSTSTSTSATTSGTTSPLVNLVQAIHLPSHRFLLTTSPSASASSDVIQLHLFAHTPASDGDGGSNSAGRGPGYGPDGNRLPMIIVWEGELDTKAQGVSHVVTDCLTTRGMNG